MIDIYKEADGRTVVDLNDSISDWSALEILSILVLNPEIHKYLRINGEDSSLIKFLEFNGVVVRT